MSRTPTEAFSRSAPMPLCATCGHRWGDHARPDHIEADVDNGERWCFEGDCRCRNYVLPASVGAVDPQGGIVEGCPRATESLESLRAARDRLQGERDALIAALGVEPSWDLPGVIALIEAYRRDSRDRDALDDALHAVEGERDNLQALLKETCWAAEVHHANDLAALRATLAQLVAELQQTTKGFQRAALNGVICTPPSSEHGISLWDAPITRIWCASCKSLWHKLFALPEKFAAALLTPPASVEQPPLATPVFPPNRVIREGES